MAVRSNRRTVVTRRILEESLLELMKEKPITQITIKEICQLADMSRSTFYLHFRDQYELLESIEKEVLNKTFENLKNLDSEINSIDSIEVFLNYVKHNESTFGILLCRVENRPFQEAIMENVRKYIMSILPARNSDEKDAVLFSFVMHGCLSVITDWINSGFEMPAHSVAEILYHACDNVVKS